MLGSISKFVKSVAAKSAKVAAASVLPRLKERSIRLPEQRLTFDEQLARLTQRGREPVLDLQGILDSQADARTALDTAIFELDHVIDALRGIELLTPGARALVGHAPAAAGVALALPAHDEQHQAVKQAA